GSPAHPPGRAREVAPRRRPRPIGAPAPPPRFHARWNGVTIAVRYIPLPPPEYRFPSQEPANNTEDVVMHQRRKNLHNPGRRDFVRAGLGIAGGLALPYGLVSEAFAAEPQHPAIGTWPDGVKGNSVVVSIAVPRRARTSSRAGSSPSSTSTKVTRSSGRSRPRPGRACSARSSRRSLPTR